MNNDNKFQEQSAPEKNTDNAYVQVGEDGKPIMPEQGNDKSKDDDISKQNEDAENTTTLGIP